MKGNEENYIFHPDMLKTIYLENPFVSNTFQNNPEIL